MMAGLGHYDELNIVEKGGRAIPYKEYFGKMDLTPYARRVRIELAEALEDIIMFALALAGVMRDYGQVNLERLRARVADDYTAKVAEFTELDDYTKNYIRDFSSTFVDNTVKNMKNEWYTSVDRARYIAENEANTVFNHAEYAEAAKKGYKRKRWVDVRDDRERETHLAVGGKVLPIGEPFVVGGSLMLYPKDTTYGADAEEIVNCRCTIRYLK